MDSKRFLVFGAGGLIGRAVVEEFDSNKYSWQGTYFTRQAPGCLKCDIMDPESVRAVFNYVKPTHVIHCAQLAGGLDFCEKNPDLSEKFHHLATITIGEECLKHRAKFVFISTECVFDGKKEHYDEDAKINPLSVYGRHKAQGEIWMRRNLKDYIIARTMSVYGWDPLTRTPNALMELYFSLLKGEKVFAPIFRWGTPTYVKDLSKAILELCLSNEIGLFHIVGSSYVNRYEWLKKTCDFLSWNSLLVMPQRQISSKDFLRPHKVRLNTSKFSSKFKIGLHNLNESLRLLKSDILSYNENKKNTAIGQ